MRRSLVDKCIGYHLEEGDKQDEIGMVSEEKLLEYSIKDGCIKNMV